MINKLLLGILIVLFIVLFGELFFYLYYLPKKQLSSLPTTSTKAPESITSTNAGGLDEQADQMRLVEIKNIQNEIKQGFIFSSILITQYKGKISNIDLKGGLTPTSKYPYRTLLILKNENNEEFFYYFLEAYLKKTTVFKVVGEKKEPMNFDDLKIGDDIIITGTYDATQKDWRFSTLKIEIIKL